MKIDATTHVPSFIIIRQIKLFLIAVAILMAIIGNNVTAAMIAVSDMSITSFSFELQPGTSGSPNTFISSGNTVAGFPANPDLTNLVGGPRTDFLSFALNNVDIGGPGGEDWTANVDTTATSPAFVDDMLNTFTINLSSLNVDWFTTGPRCGPTFPSCENIALGPMLGPIIGEVTGPWNPATNTFNIAWQTEFTGHPFPTRIASWNIQGVANPIPIPSALILFITGILGIVVVTRKEVFHI